MLWVIDCCLCRSLFGNVASLVMLDSASGSSFSSIKDGNPVTVTGLESVEGEVLQFVQPVRLFVCVHVYVCPCVFVSVCVYVSVCVCVCVRVCVCYVVLYCVVSMCFVCYACVCDVCLIHNPYYIRYHR